jgi:hypothetical protein
MMPMHMRRKARKLEKVENLSRTATPQNILPRAGTNQITLARFCGRILSSRRALFECHVLRGCHAVHNRCLGRAQMPNRPPAGQLAGLARSARLTLARSEPIALWLRSIWPSETAIQQAIAALAGYESFRRRIL